MGSSFDQRFVLLAMIAATFAGSALTTRDAAGDICEHPATQDKMGKCVCPPGMKQTGNTCSTAMCPPGTKLAGGKCVSTCPADKTLVEGKCVDASDKLPVDAGKTVQIAAGNFTAGSTDSSHGRADPVHKVTLSTFSIDKYEVSVEEYDKCVKSGICSKPQGVEYGCNYPNAKRRAHPMNCVTWNEAQTFCDWRGMRLPTEAEWEYAARGAKSSVYPWGDTPPTCKTAAMTYSSNDPKSPSCGGNTSVIGSHGDGKSPFGVHDLAGNVEEWIWDEYGYYKPNVSEMTEPGGPINGTDHVVKGGAYDLAGAKVFAAARRISAEPGARHVWLGFRCAKGPAPKATPAYFNEVPIVEPIKIEKPKTPTISIPGGTFMMGRDGDASGSPAHSVTLSSYQLDTYEVTVADYRLCMDDKKCVSPQYDSKQSCNYDLTGHGLHPINCVKHRDAASYCSWMGKRLPTEAEWEFAARGPAGRLYPWGNGEPSCSLTTFTGASGVACNVENGKPVSMALGQIPAGVGYFGNFDLAGNVGEFVSDYFAPYQAVAVTDPKGAPSGLKRVLRGGSFKTSGVNAISRQVVDDNWFGDAGGFRCAKSL